MEVKGLIFDKIEDWQTANRIILEASDTFNMVEDDYSIISPSLTPREAFELSRRASADSYRVIAIIDSLIKVKLELRVKLSKIKNEWELLYIKEQSSDAYQRSLLTNRSWTERENAVKLNHIVDYKLLLEAQKVFDCLLDLIERLKGIQYFIYQYQRTINDLVRLTQVTAILSDTDTN